jgi:hypothetical protein
MGLPPKRVLGAALTATKVAPSIDRKNSKRMLHNMVNACKYINIYIKIYVNISECHGNGMEVP